MHRPSLFLLIGLVGCGSDAPAPDEVRARIAKDLVTVANSAEASLADGAAFPDTAQFALLQTAFSQLSSKIPTEMFEEDLPDMDMEDPFDGAKAAQWLNDHLFTDANHAGDGIYNVPASLACDSDEGVECAKAFAQFQLRIRVSEDDDRLMMALQIGPNHDEPLEVGLSARLLSLSIDLDETEDAVRAMLPKLGEDAPNFKLDGKLTAELEAISPASARVSLEIDRGIWVRFADAGESLDGPTAFDFSSKAAKVLALALDGTSRSMDLTLGLGHTEAKIPDEIDGTTQVRLDGLTAEVHYAEGTPLKFSNVGIGNAPFALLVDGQNAVHAELNPNDGHVFHGQITGDLLEVSPRFDFRTMTNHALLDETAPVYDVRRIFLEGAVRGRADDSLEVVRGSFSIETNPSTYGFTAGEGQCVRGSEVFDTARDDYYTQFSVGACN